MLNMGEAPKSYDELLAAYQAQQEQIFRLTEELTRLKRLIAGAKSERFVSAENGSQIELGLGTKPDGTAPPSMDGGAVTVTSEEVSYTRKKVKRSYTPHGRNPLPADLPRNTITIEPEEDTTGMKRIGEEVTEELECKPPVFYVNQYVRPKYARAGGDGVVIGMLPVRPIEKGIAGPSLLSHMMISKYVDHVPLYRLRKQIARAGIKIPASTLDGWMCRSCELIEPLYEHQRSLVQNAAYLMADETPIRVQDSKTRGKCHKGYYWVYYDPLVPVAFFEYQETRARAGPEEMLRDFSGYLQTDGYAGYDIFGTRDSITHLGCFAHARRYFTDALESDMPRAEWMLLRIQKLYEVERQARESAFTHDERYALRQDNSLPVLQEIHAWLQERRYQVLPKSAIGKAVAYILKYWQRLNVYTTNGMLEIDNNLVENAIRPVALGRKNYLFAGSHDGARRAAMVYSLVVTAQLHGREPFAYFSDVINRLPMHPHKRLAELLPQNWSPLKAKGLS